MRTPCSVVLAGGCRNWDWAPSSLLDDMIKILVLFVKVGALGRGISREVRNVP